MPPKETKIKGTISNITFQNSEGWSVFTVELESEDTTTEADDDPFDIKETMNCTGTLIANMAAGDKVTCSGKLTKHKTYGEQLVCLSILPEAPDLSSDEGVEALLTRLPGVGPVKAKKAVEKHGGQQAWKYALEDPGKLGVHQHKIKEAMALAESLIEDREALIYLLGIGLTDNQASKVIKVYRHDSIEIVRDTPYRLISDVSGFGFMIVDGIALKAGIKPQAQARIMACVDFILNNGENEGHTYLSGKRLCAMGADFLIESAKKHMVPLNNMPGFHELRSAVYQLQSEGLVRIDDGRVFSTHLMNCEKVIFDALSDGGQRGQ